MKSLLATLASLLSALPAAGQTELARLSDPFGRRYDQLGEAVAIDGNLVLAGVPSADYLRPGLYDQTFTYYLTDWKRNAGAAVLFDRTTGDVLHVFRPRVPRHGGIMGTAVALKGTTAVLGEPFASGDGLARVVDTTTGKTLFELNAPAGGYGFGYALAIDDSRIAVGGPWIAGEGLVAIHDRTTGALLTSIPSPLQTGTFLNFGRSLALDGDKLLVGAPGNYLPGHLGGRAYLFDAGTGALLAEYEAADAEAHMGFGARVALEGERVLVAAPEANFNGFDSGAAYLFEAGTGVQLAKFESSGGAAQDRFGAGAALEQGRVLIGARAEDGASSGSGIVHVYAAGDGAPLGSFWPAAGQAGEQFGTAIDAQGDFAVIGARYRTETATASGAAYVFDLGGY